MRARPRGQDNMGSSVCSEFPPTSEDFLGLGDCLAASKLGRKGLEMNKDAVSDADGETFRASQGWGGE